MYQKNIQGIAYTLYKVLYTHYREWKVLVVEVLEGCVRGGFTYLMSVMTAWHTVSPVCVLSQKWAFTTRLVPPVDLGGDAVLRKVTLYPPYGVTGHALLVDIYQVFAFRMAFATIDLWTAATIHIHDTYTGLLFIVKSEVPRNKKALRGVPSGIRAETALVRSPSLSNRLHIHQKILQIPSLISESFRPSILLIMTLVG